MSALLKRAFGLRFMLKKWNFLVLAFKMESIWLSEPVVPFGGLYSCFLQFLDPIFGPGTGTGPDLQIDESSEI